MDLDNLGVIKGLVKAAVNDMRFEGINVKGFLTTPEGFYIEVESYEDLKKVSGKIIDEKYADMGNGVYMAYLGGK